MRLREAGTSDAEELLDLLGVRGGHVDRALEATLPGGRLPLEQVANVVPLAAELARTRDLDALLHPRVGLHLRHVFSTPGFFVDSTGVLLRPRDRSGSLRVEVVCRTLRLLGGAGRDLGLVLLDLLRALRALRLYLGLTLGDLLGLLSFHVHARLGLLLVRSEHHDHVP